MRTRFLIMIALAATFPMCSQAADAAVARGKIVFEHWCLPCHGAGPGHPGTAALAVKYKDTKPPELQRRTDLTVVYVETLVRHGFSIMAPFRKTEIADAELDDLARYLTTSKELSSRHH